MPETVTQMFERIEQQVKKRMKKQDIICPKCAYVFDQESTCDLVTYYGEEDPVEIECPECEAKLMVDEQVTREFEVTVKAIGDTT